MALKVLAYMDALYNLYQQNLITQVVSNTHSSQTLTSHKKNHFVGSIRQYNLINCYIYMPIAFTSQNHSYCSILG